MIDLNKLTDEQLVKFIKHRTSAYAEKRDEIDTANRYYNDRHDILDKKRIAIGKDGRAVEVLNLPNTQIVDNQYAKAVDQKKSYLFSFPPIVQSDDQTYQEALVGLFDERFTRSLGKIAKDAYNAGVSYAYVRLSEDGQDVSLVKINSDEIVPCWADRNEEKLQAVIRRYSEEEFEDERIKTVQRCTLYLPHEYLEFKVKDDSYELIGRQPYIQKNGKGLRWDKMPIVYFKANEQAKSVLSTAVKTLQDSINLMVSNFQDNMLEDPRNTVLVVKNYGGEDFTDLRQKIASTGIIGVETVDNVAGGVDALRIEINSENYKLMLQILKDKLIENARALDVKQEKAGNAPNELNIKSMYSDIELDANETELEFRASLEYFFEFVKKVKGLPEESKATISFKRNIMVNEAGVVEIIKNSVGILSNETLIANHPYVDDAAEELERIKKEREETMDEGYHEHFHDENGVTDEKPGILGAASKNAGGSKA